jgi:serine/threonine protein kinase
VFVEPRFKEYINRFTIDQLRLYLYSLFTALHHMHRHAVIHRDVKVSPLTTSPSPAPTHEYLILLYFLSPQSQPSNFLYSIERNEFLLVDFGLAELDESKVLQAENSSDVSLQNYSTAFSFALSLFPLYHGSWPYEGISHASCFVVPTVLWRSS